MKEPLIPVAKDNKIAEIEVYRACRDYIVAQDTILTARAGWLLTINSLTITGLAASLALADKGTLLAVDIAIGVCLFAVIVNVWFAYNLNMAADTNASISSAYTKFRESGSDNLRALPYVTFGYLPRGQRPILRRCMRTSSLAVMFILLWVIALLWSTIRLPGSVGSDHGQFKITHTSTISAPK